MTVKWEMAKWTLTTGNPDTKTVQLVQFCGKIMNTKRTPATWLPEP